MSHAGDVVLDRPLTSGVIPPVLVGAGRVALAFLLGRRRGHDWRVGSLGLETALPWLATRLHLTA